MDTVSPLGLAQMKGESVTIAGVSYRLAPLTVDQLAELEAWVMTRLPDPIAVAREVVQGLPAEIARDILMQAYEDVKNGSRRLGSPEATKVLGSFAGYREMLSLAGKKYQPDMTRDDWGQVVLAAIKEDVEAGVGTLADRFAEANGGAIPDPKAGTPSSATTTDGPPTGVMSSNGSPSITAGIPSGSDA